MKNIQVIDGADNCVYDVFEVSDKDFVKIFPQGQDIAFVDEVYKRAKKKGQSKKLDEVFAKIWKRRIPKRLANGIHGLLFYQLEKKKIYYPDRRDDGAINPNGTRLR